MNTHGLKSFLVKSGLNRTLSITAAVAGMAMANTAQAQFPLPFYEGFPASYTNAPTDENVQVPQGGSTYPARRIGNGSSANVWTIGGSPGGGSAVIVGGPAALSYPNLAVNPTPTAGLYIRTNNTTATRSRGFLFTTISSGSLYASFLVNAEQAPEAGTSRLFAKLDNAVTGTGSSLMAGVWLTSENTLAISKSSNATPTADTGTPLTPGTHLVVVRYTFDPEGLDEVALWVDPTELNVAEGSVPAPTLTSVDGNNVGSLSSFYIYHIGTEVPASLFVDEIRVGTTWAEVTPTGTVCINAGLVTDVTDQNVTEGVAATFSFIASGTSPEYQWETSVNQGAVWSPIAGATNSSYTTPNLTTANSGTQYRAIATVPCNSSSVTSSVANLTVEAAVITPLGLVVHDKFEDFWHQDPPVAISNSVWYGTSGLDGSSGAGMTAVPATGSALWLGYFTDDAFTFPVLPVHLDVGHEIKATLVFTPNNPVENGGNSMRFGLFDYADGGTRVTADGFGGSAGNGSGVRGYMLTLNFGTTFNTDTPMSLYARNNLTAGDLMGTTANYASLGSGPVGGDFSGTPAFQSGIEYTLEFTVARTGPDAAQITTRIVGGTLDFSFTVTDTTFGYPRFDAFGIRANNLATTAESFLFSEFKVEVLEASVPIQPFEISAIELVSPGNVKLTWESMDGVNYHVLSAESLTPPSWSTNATVSGTGSSTSYTNGPATGMERYFRIQAVP